MPRTLRLVAFIAVALVATASLADARGGGAGGGFAGAKRGKKTTRSSAQTERLIHDAYRRDCVSRSRLVDW